MSTYMTDSYRQKLAPNLMDEIEMFVENLPEIYTDMNDSYRQKQAPKFKDKIEICVETFARDLYRYQRQLPPKADSKIDG